jgi:hypothetical protein
MSWEYAKNQCQQPADRVLYNRVLYNIPVMIYNTLLYNITCYITQVNVI